VSVQPSQSFHIVKIGEENHVTSIEPVGQSELWINGGFFIFRKEIFEYVNDGEELVHEPFARLIKQNQLITYPYRGFWACLDTFKEKQMFDELFRKGDMPWAVWGPGAKDSAYHLRSDILRKDGNAETISRPASKIGELPRVTGGIRKETR
jgi:glucose-1-phosphate cytidylyltransferase